MFRFVQRKYEEDAMLDMHYDFNYIKILLHKKKSWKNICQKLIGNISEW